MDNKFIIDNKRICKILYFQLLYAIFSPFLIDIFHFPNFINYGLDLINFLVILFFIKSKTAKRRIHTAGLSIVMLSVISLVIFVIINGILHFVKPPLIIWAFRNTMRFYPMFFSIVVFWDEKMIEKVVQLFLKLQVPNFIIVLFQFYILGYQQDSIGGIFGHISGCNGYLNIYLCIVTIFSVERYIHKKIRFKSLLFCLGMVMLSSVFAELKVAFIEIPLIIILALILNKPSIKLIMASCIVIMLIPIGIEIICRLFPQWADSFLSLDAFLSVGNEIGGGYNISRISAFSDIDRLIFRGDTLKNLFGLGFGNCEYSNFSFLTSEFYQSYGELHYRWFTHQMWFLECGYVGIILYILFFLLLFLWFNEQKLKYKDNYGFRATGQILIVIILLNFIYNFTLRSEAGYIILSALALSCAHIRCKKEEQWRYNTRRLKEFYLKKIN